MKRIVTIQDISCIGKCSLTVALPIISATGIETAILPTTILSTHTAFQGFTFRDLSMDINAISKHWQKEKFKFDAIYTGYMGNIEQIELVKKFLKDFNSKDNIILVDPAMADNGKLYPGFNNEFVSKMKELCDQADIIVPNVTEACLLAGIPFNGKMTLEEIKTIAIELSKKIENVVITDINIGNKIGILSYNSKTKEFYSYFRKKINAKYHGTGDVFASALVGSLANGISINKSLKIAVDYTWEAIKETYEKEPKDIYGVNFETKLPFLINRIHKEK